MVPLTPPKQPIAKKKQCSASSYGTFDIRLRAAKSLTTSMGNKMSTDRMPIQVIFM